MCFLIGSGNEVFILSWCLNFRKKQKRGFYDEIEYCNCPIYYVYFLLGSANKTKSRNY